ncbi:nucleotidyl transferase AbiEii/AbiGii toxin family protein [Flavobacteriaceae bacterium F89]|uniref:Nucleotidyl transferase AbiEii/AbiGii toxin family protein n=1 Tax=Cerina litoralis TaxID=2874477 RepID=A0AAE3ERI1_9FLAO|nr:nucleotidyl transferase AbiEii/AbiGii toxin family protein [Cerina litoralis]MCG2459770.1 nucleotidyl transferase AbiEii/AbiGii toxin family protein [Cerina litoralis]
MSAVSDALKNTIKELQRFPTLENFALGGGTNLALRYNHRKSVDIDLFCAETIGISGFENIAKQIKEYYGDRISGLDFPCKIDNQYVFMRFFVRQEGEFIKVEVLQNFQRLDANEIFGGIKLLTVKDVGLLKLITCSNRASQKDIYDIDLITDLIPLEELYRLLRKKEDEYSEPGFRTIFDLDDEKSPVRYPELLIKFDEIKKTSVSRPSHSHDRVEIMEGGKTWKEARYSWLKKVRGLFRDLDVPYPKPKGLDLS